jgi:hypothetical protein
VCAERPCKEGPRSEWGLGLGNLTRYHLHWHCVSLVRPFYDRLRAARRRDERLLGATWRLGSGCALKTSRVSCCLITLSSSSAPTSLSSSIIPISRRICSWIR